MAELTARQQFEEELARQAWSDDAFRTRLLTDPESTVRGQLPFELPEGVDIKVIDEPANSYYVVLPADPRGSKELSDRQLDAAAGGSGGIFDSTWSTTCSLTIIHCC